VVLCGTRVVKQRADGRQPKKAITGSMTLLGDDRKAEDRVVYVTAVSDPIGVEGPKVK